MARLRSSYSDPHAHRCSTHPSGLPRSPSHAARLGRAERSHKPRLLRIETALMVFGVARRWLATAPELRRGGLRAHPRPVSAVGCWGCRRGGTDHPTARPASRPASTPAGCPVVPPSASSHCVIWLRRSRMTVPSVRRGLVGQTNGQPTASTAVAGPACIDLTRRFARTPNGLCVH